MLKKELRTIIRNRKRQLSQSQLDGLSLAVIGRLRSHQRFVNARTLLLYHSLSDEVCTHRLIEETEGKTVLLPRVVSETDLELRLYTGPHDLQVGAFGIMEPCGEVFTDYGSIDLAVIPGMAFDRHGNRLGRGKGYYDRMLAHLTNAYKIGICFDFQLVDEVPTEPTDIPMDEIVS